VNPLAKKFNATYPSTVRALQILLDEGILIETTGNKRNKQFISPAILDALELT